MLIEIPRTISRISCTVADGQMLSIRDQSAIQKAFLNAGSSDTSCTPTSKSSVHRYLRENRLKTAATIKSNFIENLPPYGFVHCDSKLIRYILITNHVSTLILFI